MEKIDLTTAVIWFKHVVISSCKAGYTLWIITGVLSLWRRGLERWIRETDTVVKSNSCMHHLIDPHNVARSKQSLVQQLIFYLCVENSQLGIALRRCANEEWNGLAVLTLSHRDLTAKNEEERWAVSYRAPTYIPFISQIHILSSWQLWPTNLISIVILALVILVITISAGTEKSNSLD